MDKVLVTIHVVATDGKDLDYNPDRDGRTKSTEDKINAIKVSDGYSVVYDDDVIVNTSLSRLVSSLVQTFSTNLKDTIFDFRIVYHYEGASDTYFDYDTAKHVLDLDDMMRKIDVSKKIPVFTYTRLDGLNGVYEDWRDEVEFNSDEDLESLLEDEDDEDDDYEGKDLLSYLTGCSKGKKREKESTDYYGRSRVWKNCKQPKKQINRHGVLVASDKDDLKKDEKIIKEFLKDFLPGDASWKKEFRNDVLQRWMSMYAISRKMLKQLEKQHRKTRKRKMNPNTEKILNFTNKMLTVPVDRWNDPNK